MIKTLGIGYTIFEFDGKTKTPIAMEKARPGNFKAELKKIEARIASRMNKNKKLFNLCVWMGAYGFSLRVLLALLQ